MVNARECDRCGEIYGEQKTIIFHPLEVWQDKEKRDLCHQCKNDLESFYDYEFGEIKEVKKLLKKKKNKSKSSNE